MTATRKIMATVVRPESIGTDEIRASLLRLTGGSVDLVEGWERMAAGEVIALVSLRDSSIEGVPHARHAWLVEERPQWDGAPASVKGPVVGVKQVTFLRRAASIDHAQFADHWSTAHAALARRHHPTLLRYRQNVVVDTLIPGTPEDVDGIAELGMRLRLDFRERMYDSDEGRRIVGEDVRRFLDLRRSWQMITREYPV